MALIDHSDIVISVACEMEQWDQN